ncbi:hypothetical protein D3C72_1533230 [compost metagenome]
MNQQLQFQGRQLAPYRVFVEFDTDQGGDVAVLVELAVFQAVQQVFQAGIVQAMQVQDVGAEQQRLVGVVPDQIFDRIHFRIPGHEDAAGRGAQLVILGRVHFLAHAGEDAEQGRRFLGI